MLAELQITRVFAAHRPDTIAIADRVIGLDRSGHAVEIRSPSPSKYGSQKDDQTFAAVKTFSTAERKL
jgi:hypothetical protein